MQTNDHQIRDYDLILDRKFGKSGTPERDKVLDEARSFYAGQILHDARKEMKMSQSQLAEKVNVTKSYVSRIENGGIVPSVGMFYRIVNALGMRIELVKTVAVL